MMVDAGTVINHACPLQKSAFWLFCCLVNERRGPGVSVNRNASPRFGTDQGTITGPAFTSLFFGKVKTVLRI